MVVTRWHLSDGNHVMPGHATSHCHTEVSREVTSSDMTWHHNVTPWRCIKWSHVTRSHDRKTPSYHVFATTFCEAADFETSLKKGILLKKKRKEKAEQEVLLLPLSGPYSIPGRYKYLRWGRERKRKQSASVCSCISTADFIQMKIKGQGKTNKTVA